MNLFRSTLSILRDISSSGYYDDNENWVDGVPSTPIPIKCSIQPFNKGKHRIEIPTGVRTNDALLIYTKTPLFTQDNSDNQTADEFSYKDRLYECIYVEDWTEHGLISDHIKAVFVRKDSL
tara:strand:+ start:681 stop:1043 length:363 start_codon:yes stop_codon:yes gene_type:complete